MVSISPLRILSHTWKGKMVNEIRLSQLPTTSKHLSCFPTRGLDTLPVASSTLISLSLLHIDADRVSFLTANSGCSVTRDSSTPSSFQSVWLNAACHDTKPHLIRRRKKTTEEFCSFNIYPLIFLRMLPPDELSTNTPQNKQTHTCIVLCNIFWKPDSKYTD